MGEARACTPAGDSVGPPWRPDLRDTSLRLPVPDTEALHDLLVVCLVQPVVRLVPAAVEHATLGAALRTNTGLEEEEKERSKQARGWSSPSPSGGAPGQSRGRSAGGGPVALAPCPQTALAAVRQVRVPPSRRYQAARACGAGRKGL